MKNIILGLGLVFVMNFGLKALGQTGCQIHCDIQKDCCDRANRDRGQVTQNCKKQYDDCLTKYANTPSDLCPNIRLCD